MKAKIFQSGNSQAVRIPKEFRFEEAEVDIFKRAKDINQHTFTEGESWEWVTQRVRRLTKLNRYLQKSATQLSKTLKL